MWTQVVEAYNAWDPSVTGSPSIDQLLAPFGISKQAFYAERRRQGMANKADWRRAPSDVPTGQAVEVLLEALIEARLRIRELEEQAGR